MPNISVKNIEFGTVVIEEMLFKDISYLELWWLLSSVERNHLCNFGRVHHEEQFREIILNLDKWTPGDVDFLSRALLALRLCWSHIPHCWKSHALAHM